MTAAVIIAVIGWVLFILTALLYFAGLRMNAAERTALAVYSLALLLSDEFRDGTRKAFDDRIEGARRKSPNTRALTYFLMQVITQAAKESTRPESGVNTYGLVLSALGGDE